jgi:hypothetical protein
MMPVAYKKCIQIIITHLCENSHKCQHCSQSVPHQAKPFTMTLAEVENALISLQDYPGHVGIFGGNPLLHPEFAKVCELLRKYVPVKARRELWCSNAKWDQYKADINETFYPELVAYNGHEDEQPCWHQPTMLSPREILDGTVAGLVEDARIRYKLIENCWVERRWSAAITPKGAFFCEVAAARAHLFGDIEGLPVVPGWWMRPPVVFEPQARTCLDCSIPLPMECIPNDFGGKELVTECMQGRLINAHSPANKRLGVCDLEPIREFLRGRTFTMETEYRKRGGFVDIKDWSPWIYRPLEEKKHAPRTT